MSNRPSPGRVQANASPAPIWVQKADFNVAAVRLTKRSFIGRFITRLVKFVIHASNKAAVSTFLKGESHPQCATPGWNEQTGMGLPPAAEVVRALGAAKDAERWATISTPEGADRAGRPEPVYAVIGDNTHIDAVQDPLKIGSADRRFAEAEWLGVNVGGGARRLPSRRRGGAGERGGGFASGLSTQKPQFPK